MARVEDLLQDHPPDTLWNWVVIYKDIILPLYKFIYVYYRIRHWFTHLSCTWCIVNRWRWFLKEAPSVVVVVYSRRETKYCGLLFSLLILYMSEYSYWGMWNETKFERHRKCLRNAQNMHHWTSKRIFEKGVEMIAFREICFPRLKVIQLRIKSTIKRASIYRQQLAYSAENRY